MGACGTNTHMAEHLTVNVKLRIDEDLQLALERLAREGDRSVAAEMRRALREYVVTKSAEAQAS